MHFSPLLRCMYEFYYTIMFFVGWQVKQSHYNLYIYLCLFFACLYSVPPLFGVGRYGYDFQCTSCTFDVILPNTWQKYIVIAIYILRSIKPTGVMYVPIFFLFYGIGGKWADVWSDGKGLSPPLFHGYLPYSTLTY